MKKFKKLIPFLFIKDTKNQKGKKDLVLKMCKISNKKITLNFDLSKPEGRFIKSSDSSLLKKITQNYKQKISLSKGLKLMMNWHERTFK